MPSRCAESLFVLGNFQNCACKGEELHSMRGNLAQTQQRQGSPRAYVYIADNCIIFTSEYANRHLEAYIASPLRGAIDCLCHCSWSNSITVYPRLYFKESCIMSVVKMANSNWTVRSISRPYGRHLLQGSAFVR